MRYFLKSVVIVVILGNSLSTWAQNTTHEDLYWIRYHNLLTISPKWAWHNEADNRRTFFGNDHQVQFIFHTHLHYRIKPWLDVAGGLSYSRVSRSISLVQPEIRPFLEFNLEKKFPKGFNIQFRHRLDNRFIQDLNATKTDIASTSTFNLRFRFRLTLSYPVVKTDKHQRIAKVADEYMGINVVYLSPVDQPWPTLRRF